MQVGWEKKKDRIIGIDLGTSNSAAAIVTSGKPEIIPSAEGTTLHGKAFPSVVAFTSNGKHIVGEPARRQAVTNPERTVTAFKRKMGTGHKYSVAGKQYMPQEIASILLKKIKADSEKFLGEEIRKAVITVPAYFNDSQRSATKQAGEMVGLEVVRIINEPTAASLAYGLDKRKERRRILVFDLGGGTLDVTILEVSEGVFEVKSTSGDTQLGGTDMDRVLVEYVLKCFKEETGFDVSKDPLAFARVREAVEMAKIQLSTETKAEVNVPFLSSGNESKHLSMTLTRDKLEELVQPIIDRCRGPTLQAISDSKLEPAHIDNVILVGGPTRMPIVQRFVEDIMGKPAEKGVDPMECVAIGASIQGGVLSGEFEDILLLDVTPLSLGIETFGGLMNTIIPRNTTIPTKAGEAFTTAVDNQREVLIHVLQGEREMATDNFSLGRFSIEVEPAPAGAPRIGVQFTIDADGILHVLARDMKTGREKTVKIKSAVDVSDEQVQKMVKESVEHAKEDIQKRQWVEAKLNAETILNATSKALAEYGQRLDDKELQEIREAVNVVTKNLQEQNAQALRAATERLDKATQHLATMMLDDLKRQIASKQTS